MAKARPTTASWLAGSMMTMACYALWTDYLGVDGYCDHVRTHWLDESVSMPIAAGLILAAVLLMSWAREKEGETDA